MEDAYIAVTDIPEMPGWSLFAVLDGHAGKLVATHTADTLTKMCSSFVSPVAHSPRGCMDGLRRAFLKVGHFCSVRFWRLVISDGYCVYASGGG